MAKLLALLVVIALGSAFAPRSAAAQTTPAATTPPAPCINGQQRVRFGRVTVGIPCTPERQAPALASSTANPVTPRPTVVVAAPATAPVVRPAPAPSGAWARVFREHERAQLARLQAAPRPYSPPPEYVTPEPPTPAPSTPPLPDPSVRHFPVWFVGIDTMEGDRQAGICVLPLALAHVRVENMSEEDTRTWCRWWRPQLSNNGGQPVDHLEERPGTANGRQADILIPRTAEWAQAVVTMYGRTGQGEWRYINQRLVTERDPGASINALDLNSGVHNLLPARMSLPSARAVAAHGHGRSHHGSHRRGARHVRHGRTRR